MDKDLMLEKFIKDNSNSLYTFCIRLTNSLLDADDLYQDTMLKLLKLKDIIDFEDNPRAFIYSLAIKINGNRIRKFYRRIRIAPIKDDYNINTYADNKESLDEICIKREEKNCIETMIENLPLKQREVILFFYMDEISLKEISKILEIPEGTVKSRLNSARNNLKKMLEEDNNGY